MTSTSEEEKIKCSICLSYDIVQPTRLNNCTHIFCYTCIKQWHEQQLPAFNPLRPYQFVNNTCCLCRTFYSVLITDTGCEPVHYGYKDKDLLLENNIIIQGFYHCLRFLMDHNYDTVLFLEQHRTIFDPNSIMQDHTLIHYFSAWFSTTEFIHVLKSSNELFSMDTNRLKRYVEDFYKTILFPTCFKANELEVTQIRDPTEQKQAREWLIQAKYNELYNRIYTEQEYKWKVVVSKIKVLFTPAEFTWLKDPNRDAFHKYSNTLCEHIHHILMQVSKHNHNIVQDIMLKHMHSILQVIELYISERKEKDQSLAVFEDVSLFNSLYQELYPYLQERSRVFLYQIFYICMHSILHIQNSNKRKREFIIDCADHNGSKQIKLQVSMDKTELQFSMIYSKT